jgi:SPX domain protein involved in polyphosphate accumulation
MIERIEYKYFVARWKSASLLSDVFPFCVPDPHAAEDDCTYHVASVYFDDMEMRAYHQKLSGQTRRTKVRVRFYPRCENSPYFLEFKQKVGDRVYKDKASVAPDMVFATKTCAMSGETLSDNVAILARYSGLKPVLRIDYERVALTSRTDSRVRITLDRNVRCARVTGDEMPEPHRPVLPDDVAVLEIKAPSYMPFFATRVVEKYRLQRRAISKYGSAVQNLAVNSSFVF